MRTPWHLWLVGIVSLLWNAVGAFDYSATQFAWEPYMSQFTPEQRSYFESFPVWVVAAWALAVWLSVAGSLLLLFRSAFAAPCLGIVLIAMALTFAHNFFLSEVTMAEVVGPEALTFSLAIVVVAVAQFLYARWMRRRGVLG
jgi:hypothetical protein